MGVKLFLLSGLTRHILFLQKWSIKQENEGLKEVEDAEKGKDDNGGRKQRYTIFIHMLFKIITYISSIDGQLNKALTILNLRK